MKKNNTKKGFSIGEVMVAMFILIYGIVSAVFLTTNSVRQIGDSRNAAIASLLAQEGTELVKNVRDNSVTQEACDISGNNVYDERCTAFEAYTDNGGNKGTSYGWPSYASGGSIDGRKIVHFNISPLITDNVDDNDKLFINSSTGFYVHGTGDTTPFRRRIYIKYKFEDSGEIWGAGPNDTNGNDADDTDDIITEVASVVMWKNGDFPSHIDNIKDECKIGKHCAFTKTNLTSWINYGE